MTDLPAGLRIVDPHIHQWDPFTTPKEVSGPAKLVRRLPFLRPVLMKLFPQRDREFVGDPTHVINTYLPADYRADAGDLPVETVVHIEAGWADHSPEGTAGETAWVETLPFGTAGPALGAVVCHADPREAGIADVLDRNLAASPRLRGIRCSAAHHPDPGVRDWNDEGLLSSPDFLRGFAAVAERGLSFEAWVYSHQLPEVVGLAQEYPETTFVLDHYGTPVGLFGPRGRRTGHTEADRREILARWSDDIAAVAALPNVVAKHSGLGMPVLGWDGPVSTAQFRDTVAPLVSRTQELFGAERTLWASNFPMDKPIVPIRGLIEALLEILGPDVDSHQLLGGNARRVYRLDNG
ncbi:amidohydrolase family protein [Nocardioides marmorisolisilvae]|uniref:Amidohydrolase n=1 Tax=Nocardioides marmorisolisilvae TaxID=1542737 RepID=A0A3N0DP47_9ACTN|nr:amidohydrolase family protein [Nocardioides marmorisolisilvae]RNL77427.1 amidohydrolase [Nocardioides marmorisolisilvae]